MCWREAGYFVVGNWLALALRTGIWDTDYLLSVPLLLLHFAIFFSVSLLLAVCHPQYGLLRIRFIAFWGICWAINYGRDSVMAAALSLTQGSVFRAADAAGEFRLLVVSQTAGS